ncbi:MAG: hypothetical protein L6R42_006699 [Xanthoria sp. 1 TBL-2021]|nr:MAG: hypothetical protein L6R42_006699 [Xanthoria sp. 1 TBL-2021]
MSRRELLEAHATILRSVHVGYGRHRVDEDLVAQAWATLGDHDRRRQYHHRLRLSDPPTEQTDHEDHPTGGEGPQSHDATSDDGSRVVQDPDFLLDDPFTEKRGQSTPKHTNKPRDPDTPVKSVETSALPPMRTFRNKNFKKPAVAPPATNPATDEPLPLRRLLPKTPAKVGKQPQTSGATLWTAINTPPNYHTIVQHPTSSVREEVDENRMRIIGWINHSAKRARANDTDSELEGVGKSRR